MTATGGTVTVPAGGALATGGTSNAGGTSGATSTGGTGTASSGGGVAGMPTAEEQCLALEQQTACTSCACAACTDLALDCFASGDATRDAACRTIVDCARANHCTNVACYCGEPPASDTCATMPQGPCVAEIQAAAGTTDVSVIGGYQQDPDHAVGRASLLGDCAAQSCATECGL